VAEVGHEEKNCLWLSKLSPNNGNGKPPHLTHGNICPYQPENEGFWDWMMVVTCRRALEKQMVLKLTEDVIGDIYIF
jgi:hypothetical protein